MQFKSFGDVAKLGQSTLRELLASGDAAERIWAAWAYAMRRGGDSVSELVKVAKEGPTPGLRRHLVVVLAGFRERECIRAFADSDPNPQVRATACLFLLQTFLRDDAETSAFLVSILRNDSAPAVRLVVLTNSKANGLEIPPNLLVELAADPDAEIRKEALNVIAEHSLEEEAVECGIADLLKSETVPELMRKIAAICVDAGQAPEVLKQAKQQPENARSVLLDFLITQGTKFDWVDLIDLTELPGRDLTERIEKLVSASSRPLMFPWLAAKLVGAIEEIQELPEYDDIWRMFKQFIFSDAVLPLSPDVKENFGPIISAIKKQISEYETEIASEEAGLLDESDYEYAKDAVITLKKAEAEVQRLANSCVV